VTNSPTRYIEERPRYVFFAAYDGAGTHIVRGLFSALKVQGLNSSVGPSGFWSIAFDAFRKRGAEQAEPLRQLNKMLEKFDVAPIEVPDRQTIHDRFEDLFSRWEIVLDFSRDIVHKGVGWTDQDITDFRAFILDYACRTDAKIKVLFLVQVRNPLDQIASLCERNANEPHGDEKDFVAAVKGSLQEILRLENEFQEALPDGRVLSTTLDDIVRNHENFTEELEKFTLAPIPRGTYMSTLSLDKWPTSETGRRHLGDDEIRRLAKEFGYHYPRPRSLKFLVMRVEAECRRQINEAKLLIDTSRGELENWNPINAKHERKPYLATRVLVKMTRGWVRQRSRFYETISRNN